MIDLHFAFYGRICAIIYFLSAVFVSCWQMIYYPTYTIQLGSYTLVAGLFVGLIELPVCFSCCGPCKKLAGYLRVVTGYWAVRGVLYAGLSAAGYVIYELPVGQVQIVSPSLLCVQILATVTAALYFVATGRCEANPAQTGDDSGRGGAAPANGAAKTETGKPAAEPAPTKPAAPLISAGRALFGGGDTQAGATAPALPAPLISAVAAPLATAAKASLFTGSSSGGRSKYGGFADDDRPEVNPFLTG